MSPTPQTADAVDVAQASELTGLSKKALRRRLERGTLDSIKVGGRRMIPISELSRRGLLDTGEGVAATAERDDPESPAAAAHQDGNGSSGPTEAALDREQPAPPPIAEPVEPAAVEPVPAVEPAGVEPAPPVEPAPVVEPASAVAPAPAGPAPAAERPTTQEPPATPPLPPPAPVAPSSPVPQLEPRAHAPQPPTATPPDAGAAASPGTMPAAATGVAATTPTIAQPPAPYPAQTPPASPAPQAVAADGGIVPPPDRYQASPEGFYPARGAWYYWYEYPALRWLAALLAIGLVALLAWLLLIRPGGESDGATPVRAGAGPVGATQEDLVTLSEELRQPVYWAGDLPGTRIELSQSTSSFAYVRYLTDDAPVGDPSPDFLTVGTYPTLNAFANLRSWAERTDARTTRIDIGGLVVIVPDSPTSVYLGYPHEDVQVEVYDPEPGRALNLVKTGVIRPVTVSTTTVP